MDALSLERQVCLWSLGLRIGPFPYTHTNCVLDSRIHCLFHGLFGSLIVLVVSVLSPSIVFNVYPITQRLLPGGSWWFHQELISFLMRTMRSTEREEAEVMDGWIGCVFAGSWFEDV